MSLTVAAHGKLNLTLYITGCREDGYHTLHTVMQSVSLADEITISQAENKNITVTCSLEELSGEENLAYKAARLFLDTLHVDNGFNIHINKKIPVAGGMGGGSADAAGVLHGLNLWYGNPFSTEELCEMALHLGADVPFCLIGGTQLATGIGEILQSLSPMPDCGILLLKPCEKGSTGAMYRKYDDNKGLSPQENCGIINWIECQNIKKVAECLENSFQSLYDDPRIEQAISALLQQGALGACLTGSGPTVFGIFESVVLAEQAAKVLACSYPVCAVTSPAAQGCQVIEREK